MLTIKRTNISLTRGDSAYITLSVTDGSGTPIELNENDTIRVQVREEPNGGTLIFEGNLIFDDDGITWYIRPEDTEAREVKVYYWDAQVEFSNGDIFTFIPVSKFTILSEVTEEVDENDGD